jgi:hypothetical protein
MRRTALLGSLLALVAAVAPLGGSGSTATAASRWAPVGDATIHPGVQMYTKGAQCTANFVFTDAAGRVYVGYAAHCAGTGEATETDADACAYNDLALVKVDAADVSKVNPSVPFWGGPVAINTTGTAPGDTVYSYGNSSLRAGITELSPKQGTSLGTEGNGWSHPVYTVTPGVPGDSGSAFLDADGNALGVLSTLALAPLAGSNGVGDLNHELGYAKAHFSSSLALSTGGPFSGGTSVLGLIKLPL